MDNAKYTVLLKTLMENPSTKDKLRDALSTYPMYQKQSKEEFIPSIVPTRDELNNKILRHYKYREIGFETVGRFLEELETSMCEIMPKYNQLFFTADQDYNIIFNVDYQRTIARDLGGNSTSKTTGSGKATSKNKDESTNTTSGSDNTQTSNTMNDTSKAVKSQTPQSELSVPASNIDGVTYADEVNWNKHDSTSTGTSTGSSTANSTTKTDGNSETTNNSTVDAEENKSEKESTLETTKGNFGVVSAQDLVQKYREIILNIEQMIINDPRITELFMLVY